MAREGLPLLGLFHPPPGGARRRTKPSDYGPRGKPGDPEQERLMEGIPVESAEHVRSREAALNADVAARAAQDAAPAAPAPAAAAPAIQTPPAPAGVSGAAAPTRPRSSVSGGPALEEATVPGSAQRLSQPAAAVPAAAPEESKPKRTPWKRLRQAYTNYMSKTQFGQRGLAAEKANEYRTLTNQRLENQILSEEEAAARQKILEAVGEDLLSEPVEMRLRLSEGGAVTKDWKDYRNTVRTRVREEGGDARAVLEAERMITEYQMSKFQELGNAAHSALALGDVRTAASTLRHAYLYMPTGNNLSVVQRGDELVAVFKDEDSGEPVGARPLTPEDLLGIVERMKNPAAWLSFTSDLDAKERGQLIESMKAEIDAGQLDVARMNAETNQQRAATEAAGSTARRRTGAITSQDMQGAFDAEVERLTMEGLPTPSFEERLSLISEMEMVIAEVPGLPPPTAAELVLTMRANPTMASQLMEQARMEYSGMADGGQPYKARRYRSPPKTR